jgi:1,2-dihydroxy-3-keto-5-methylthiopentene dioxygenase
LLHVDELVYAITCIAGDVIGVPSGMKHWFDAGENPSFTVLRVFTKEDGWLPHYTGWEK